MVGTIDVEGEAAAIYRAAGADPHEPCSMVRLAQFLLGGDAVQVHAGIGSLAVFNSAAGAIWVRSGLAERALNHAVGHELGEWWLRRHHYSAEQIEAACDAIASALVMPRPAFRHAVKALGRNLPALSEVFVATQSMVALRLGEVTGSPLALVTPRNVRVRGDAWGWPGEDELRRLARAPEVPPGLTRERLSDVRERRVLLAVA